MRILAVDLGKARTGLAVCDEGELLASPVGVIQEYNRERLAAAVAAKAGEYRVGEIVVGLPRNMDGSEGESAQSARAFAEQLRALIDVPVLLQDERGTTITAHGYLNVTDTRGKKREGCGRCGGGNDHFRGLSDVPPESEAFVQQLNRVTTMGTDMVSMVFSLLLKFIFVFYTIYKIFAESKKINLTSVINFATLSTNRVKRGECAADYTGSGLCAAHHACIGRWRAADSGGHLPAGTNSGSICV